jgi:HD-like signal output (HDOD) protein
MTDADKQAARDDRKTRQPPARRQGKADQPAPDARLSQALLGGNPPKARSTIKRMMESMRTEWCLTPAEDRSSGDGSAAAEQGTPDLAIPPGQSGDGVRMFERMGDAKPSLVRTALKAGMTDRSSAWPGKAADLAPPPPRAGELTARLTRVAELEKFVANPSLRNTAFQVCSLPCLAQSRRKLILQLDRGEASIRDVAETVCNDIGMAAKMMQLAGSGFFGECDEITTPEQAVSFLGLGNIKSLVMADNLFEQFPEEAVPGFSMSALCAHSLAVSAAAEKLCAAESGDAREIRCSRVAGLLHDVGMLMFAWSMPNEYAAALEEASTGGLPLHVVETAAFGADHGRIGAYLMGLWGLPDDIVHAIAFHHRPSAGEGGSFGPVAAVHAADALIREAACGEKADLHNTIDTWYLSAIGSESRVPAWRAICGEVIGEGKAE